MTLIDQGPDLSTRRDCPAHSLLVQEPTHLLLTITSDTTTLPGIVYITLSDCVPRPTSCYLFNSRAEVQWPITGKTLR
jgi:hypothetical protein